ncbi:MAG: hypothetical protein JW786_05525 [Desulfobacterales bacterium]|nr:hypothetical protein [Desulfobacterales bacterium]
MLRKRSGQVAKLGQTRTWNWQQGCMLQWYPGKDNHILFNDYDQEQDKYISKVINRSGQLKKTYPIPVNSVSRCGKFALSLNYDRLARMRPDYGYFNKKNNDLPVDDHEDGIWYLDLSSRQTKLLITLEQLKSLSYSTTMENATHKVNHIDINPGGTRFMFLHRWIGPQGRFMRLITANQDGSGLFILNGDIMTSHCCWLSDKEILSFCEYNGKRGYFKFEDQTKKAILISEKFPIVDGHPSISPDSKWIITDTYPDKARFSSLYLYNFQDDIILELGRFFQPLQYKGEKRTDLHPKWSNFSEKIYFESSHTGKRTFYEFKLNEML